MIMKRNKSTQPMCRALSPVPLPGECIYGFTSRFSAKWFQGGRDGAGLMVGRKTAPIDRCLPRHLSELAARLPPQVGLTAVDLVRKHTALPMFLPFLNERDAQRATEAATTNGHLPFILGCAQSRLPSPKYLRVCEQCSAEDISAYGAPYFHREAQVGCVLVCSKHHQPLCITDLAPGAVFASQRFGTPETCRTVASEFVHERWRPHLIAIARDVSLLLGGACPAPGALKLYALYVHILQSRGFVRADGSIRLRRLLAAFEDHYGADLLARLDCRVSTANRGGWLGSLVRHPRNNQQPIRHLLLWHFLGLDCQSALYTAESQVPPTSRSVARPHVHRIRNPRRLAKLLPTKQAAWLCALRTHTTGSLREDQGALYAWLWRNSREWLLQHRPNRFTTPKPVHTHWYARDNEIASLIPAVANRLRSQTSPFRRASRNAIASETGKPSWLVCNHSKLPRSIAAIKLHAETPEQYALRRIHAVARMNGPIEGWQLRVKSGVSTALVSRSHPVASAIKQLSKPNTCAIFAE